MKKAKLTGKVAIGLIIGGDLLLLALGWFALIGPQRATATSIVQATAAAEAQIIEAKRPIKIVKPTAVVQPEIRTADLYSLAKAMPSTEDMPNLLLQLDQVARSAGVTLTSIAPGLATPVTGSSFSTVTLTLALSGDFYSLTDLLYRLRSLVAVRDGTLQTAGRLYSINSVGLTPTGTGSQLNATVIMNAYVYGAAAGAAGALAPTPASTSTDTTSTSTSGTQTTTATSSGDDVAPRP